MLRVKKLRLSHVGRHEAREFEYRNGIIGILGSNGAGKSTLIDAAQYFGLTGNTPEDTIKDDLLQWGKKSGYTEYVFEYMGKEYILHRELQKSGKHFLKSVDTEISGKAEVDTAVIDMLGMSFEVFRETAFSSQGQFSKMIDMTHSERVEWLQKLAGMANLERIRSALQEYINKFPVYTNHAAEREAAAESLVQLSQKIEEYKKSLGDCTQQETLEAEILALETLLSKCPSVTVVDLSSEEARYDKHRQYLQKQVDLQGLQERKTNIPEKLIRPSDEVVRALESWLAENKPVYQMAKSKVCPTCKRPFDLAEPDAIIAVWEEENSKLQKASKEYRQKLSEYEFANAAHIAAMTTIKDINERKVRLLKELSGLEKYAEFDEAGFLGKKQAVLDASKKNAEKANLLTQITNRKRNLDVLANSVKSIELEIVRMEEQQKMLSRRLEEFRAEEEKAAKVAEARSLFEKARDVLHKDRLPRFIIKRLGLSVNTRMSYYLEKFDVDFTGRLTDDLDFVVSFPGRGIEDRPAKKALSGGQKVAMAVAFRLALGDVFGGHLPFLVLDEPTVFLDKDNRRSLVSVLLSVREFAERNACIIVSTHDEELMQVFSKTEVLE